MINLKAFLNSTFTFSAILFSNFLFAQTYTIKTIAGNGKNGYSGDGGPAIKAELDNPCGVATDTLGNIYIADDGNNTDCVRKINSKGIISTIIGGRSDEYPPDDDAIIPQQDYPTAIAVDAAGNIFIADKTNRRIKEISNKGVITVLLNIGNGKDTYFPVSIAVDDSDNIYFADNKHRVQKISYSNHTLSILAGNGTAGFSGDHGPAKNSSLDNPTGIAIDKQGNIYIADEGNNRIRRINSQGIIETIAGVGQQGFSGDGNQATQAMLGHPTGITIDKTGNVYFTDYLNCRIRKIDASGVISTIAGNGTSGYNGDGAKACMATLNIPFAINADLSGNLLFVDYGNHCVRKIDTKGNISTIAGGNNINNSYGDKGPATAAELFFPAGVAVDKTGNIYSTDKDGNRVRKINTAGIISTIAGNGEKGYTGNGKLSITSKLSAPSGVAVDGFGNIYIADLGNSCIRKINPKGIISTIAGNGTTGFSGDGGAATAAVFYHPYGLAVDLHGNIYVADYGNHRIRKIDNNGIITTIAGTGKAGYSGDGGPGIQAELNYPAGVATDDSGNVYIADESNNRIRKIDSKGIITTIAGTGEDGYSGDSAKAILAKLGKPLGVAVDGDGNIYITDSDNNRIRKIDRNGIIYTIAGDGNEGHKGDGGDASKAEINSPYGIAVDQKGNVYFADNVNQQIRVLINNGSTKKK